MIGYNTHGCWANAKEIYELEKERGNVIDQKLLASNFLAIWICKNPVDAVRYLRTADEWDTDLYPPTDEELNALCEIDLSGAEHIKSMDDGDEGELWIKPI